MFHLAHAKASCMLWGVSQSQEYLRGSLTTQAVQEAGTR